MTTMHITSEADMYAWYTWCGETLGGSPQDPVESVWIEPSSGSTSYLKEWYLPPDKQWCPACLDQMSLRTLANLDI